MNALITQLMEELKGRLASMPILSGLDILSRVRPSVRMATKRAPLADLESGETRIGGSPDVPPRFEWPRWHPAPKQDIYGKPWHPDKPTPLGFIAQLDLSALPRIDEGLPESGWLYFFYDRNCEPWGYDPADRGCCRVIYANCERTMLTRMDPPADAEPNHSAHATIVEARLELTLPEGVDIEFGSAEYEEFEALRSELLKPASQPYHRFLGHPQLIQNPMELQCQLASNGVFCGDRTGYDSAEAKVLETSAADWLLLLQIDTDEDGPGWCWGTYGKIYFWIKKQDLAAMRFDDVWLVFQMS